MGHGRTLCRSVEHWYLTRGMTVKVRHRRPDAFGVLRFKARPKRRRSHRALVDIGHGLTKLRAFFGGWLRGRA
jgi:hypothetical protein